MGMPIGFLGDELAAGWAFPFLSKPQHFGLDTPIATQSPLLGKSPFKVNFIGRVIMDWLPLSLSRAVGSGWLRL